MTKPAPLTIEAPCPAFVGAARKTGLSRDPGSALQRRLGSMAGASDVVLRLASLGRQADRGKSNGTVRETIVPAGPLAVLQAKKLQNDKLNVVGEHHDESGARRDVEKQIASEDAGGGYWQEYDFRFSPLDLTAGGEDKDRSVQADPHTYRLMHRVHYLSPRIKMLTSLSGVINKLAGMTKPSMEDKFQNGYKPGFNQAMPFFNGVMDEVEQISLELELLDQEKLETEIYDDQAGAVDAIRKGVVAATDYWKRTDEKADEVLADTRNEALWIELGKMMDELVATHLQPMVQVADVNFGGKDDIMKLRNTTMNTAAQVGAQVQGVWKIGNEHATDIAAKSTARSYNLMTRDDFYNEPAYMERLKKTDT